MEKVVVVLAGGPGIAGAATGIAAELAGAGAGAGELRRRGATRIQLNVVDPALGNPHGIAPDPEVLQLAAMLSYWVPSAGEEGIHSGVLPAVADGDWHGYVVCEAVRLQGPPAGERGERSPGFTQVVPLSVPGHLSWGEWRRRWQGDHTAVAIETQSSFRYVQNLVVRPTGDGAPAFSAIVEESFPLQAASDLSVFYDSVGDPARLERNMARMLESCVRFMGAKVPIAWTAEYRLAD